MYGTREDEITITEAAQILNTSRRTVYDYIRQGYIPVKRIHISPAGYTRKYLSHRQVLELYVLGEVISHTQEGGDAS